jgi:hypothetical protein
MVKSQIFTLKIPFRPSAALNEQQKNDDFLAL